MKTIHKLDLLIVNDPIKNTNIDFENLNQWYKTLKKSNSIIIGVVKSSKDMFSECLKIVEH